MNNKGFSLVELLVVIAIMAILAGVAVPVYSHYVQDSYKGADNDYVAEIYRLASLEAATRGLKVEKVVVALENEGNTDNSEDAIDYTGRLAVVVFEGQNREITPGYPDQDPAFDEDEAEVIKAVWEKLDPHEFQYKEYLAWAIPGDEKTYGVYYTRDADVIQRYPYTISVDLNTNTENDQEVDNGIKLPSISI